MHPKGLHSCRRLLLPAAAFPLPPLTRLPGTPRPVERKLDPRGALPVKHHARHSGAAHDRQVGAPQRRAQVLAVRVGALATLLGDLELAVSRLRAQEYPGAGSSGQVGVCAGAMAWRVRAPAFVGWVLHATPR